uniref:Insulin-like domain-containing protein n=1 Tax=Erpetoichthys calabaricus TaxID=27687 RepID=A0A8C4RIU8_ERPCA
MQSHEVHHIAKDTFLAQLNQCNFTIIKVSCLVAFLLLLTFPVVHSTPTKRLCGGDLVDALQFVCGDFSFRCNPGKKPNLRILKNLLKHFKFGLLVRNVRISTFQIRKKYIESFR